MNPKAYELIIDWSGADDCYVVKVPDLPGCMAHGDTRQEAVKQAEVAISFWLETAKEDGIAIPAPRSHQALA
jgi:predicted RNase H-like HicB family nuclease